MSVEERSPDHQGNERAGTGCPGRSVQWPGRGLARGKAGDPPCVCCWKNVTGELPASQIQLPFLPPRSFSFLLLDFNQIFTDYLMKHMRLGIIK